MNDLVKRSICKHPLYEAGFYIGMGVGLKYGSKSKQHFSRGSIDYWFDRHDESVDAYYKAKIKQWGDSLQEFLETMDEGTRPNFP